MIEWEGKERDLIRLQHMSRAIQLIKQFCKGKGFKEFEKDEFFNPQSFDNLKFWERQVLVYQKK